MLGGGVKITVPYNSPPVQAVTSQASRSQSRLRPWRTAAGSGTHPAQHASGSRRPSACSISQAP